MMCSVMHLFHDALLWEFFKRSKAKSCSPHSFRPCTPHSVRAGRSPDAEEAGDFQAMLNRNTHWHEGSESLQNPFEPFIRLDRKQADRETLMNQHSHVLM